MEQEKVLEELNVINANKPIDDKEKASWFKQLIDALLEALHKKGAMSVYSRSQTEDLKKGVEDIAQATANNGDNKPTEGNQFEINITNVKEIDSADAQEIVNEEGYIVIEDEIKKANAIYNKEAFDEDGNKEVVSEIEDAIQDTVATVLVDGDIEPCIEKLNAINEDYEKSNLEQVKADFEKLDEDGSFSFTIKDDAVLIRDEETNVGYAVLVDAVTGIVGVYDITGYGTPECALSTETPLTVEGLQSEQISANVSPLVWCAKDEEGYPELHYDATNELADDFIQFMPQGTDLYAHTETEVIKRTVDKTEKEGKQNIVNDIVGHETETEITEVDRDTRE